MVGGVRRSRRKAGVAAAPYLGELGIGSWKLGVDKLHEKKMSQPWYQLSDPDSVPSPALLIYKQRVDENLRRMLAIAGSPERLRPHVKTHKVPQIVRAQIAQGVTRFKCATIAEAEMTAEAGASDVLLAYQPVGPHIQRLVTLADRYPTTAFSA